MVSLAEAKVKKKVLAKNRKRSTAFFSELKQELKKVNWTTKEDLISATKIVIVSVFGFGIGIYLVDLAIKGLLTLIKKLFVLIFG